jgi:transforming growth factor-beta-induced protein
MLTKKMLVTGIAGALVLSACAAPATPAPTSTPVPTAPPPTEAPAPDIVDTAVAAGTFTTLAAALEAAGLVETLKGEGPFTVFAPTDEAFAKLDKALLDDLLKPENKDTLVAILTYHVVPGKVTAADVVNLTSAKTVQGEEITIKVDGNTVMVNDAKVTQTDIAARNGVIHVIDTVILPPTVAEKLAAPAQDIVEVAVAAGNFKTLAAALEAAGLVETLKGEGPFTVFAPTDEAFAKLDKALLDDLLKPENKDTLVAILTYHVVPGKVTAADVVKLNKAKTVQGEEITIKVDGNTVMVNDAKVTQTDIAASNGVIHVIDTVILPPTVAEKLAAPAQDIVEVAVAAGNFKTLAAALEAAGLVETLKGEGPFTVFAPTDEAFAKLDKKLLDDLLKPENKDTLVAILTYHVVPGKVTAADVVNLTSAETVQGEEITIKVDGNTVMVNDAKVTQTDIAASNGVIHVIDTVILPPTVAEKLAAPAQDIVEVAVAAGNFKTLAAALEAAGLVETLKGEGPFTVFAPTDEAFAKLDKKLLDDLLKPENKDTLVAILTYHVVPGKVTAADVVKLNKAKTVQGEEITIKVDGNTVMVNDAKVTQTDIAASNGVIHVIDTVILPPSLR